MLKNAVSLIVAGILAVSMVVLFADTGNNWGLGGSGSTGDLREGQLQTHKGDGILVSFMLVDIDADSDPYWYANGGIIRRAAELAGLGENFINRPRALIPNVIGADFKELAGKYPVVLGSNSNGLYSNGANMQSGVSFSSAPTTIKHVKIQDVYNWGTEDPEVLKVLTRVSGKVTSFVSVNGKNLGPDMQRNLMDGWQVNGGTPEYTDLRSILGPPHDMNEGALSNDAVLDAIAWQVIFLNASISAHSSPAELVNARNYLIEVLEAGTSGDMSKLGDAKQRVATLIEPLVWYGSSGGGLNSKAGTPLQLAGAIWTNASNSEISGQNWFEMRRQFVVGAAAPKPATQNWLYTGPEPQPGNPLLYNENNSSYGKDLKFSGKVDISHIRAGWSSFYVPVFNLAPKSPDIDVIRIFEELDDLGNVVNRVLIDGGNQHIIFRSKEVTPELDYFNAQSEAKSEIETEANLEVDRRYGLDESEETSEDEGTGFVTEDESGKPIIAFADTLGSANGPDNQWELYSYFIGNRDPENLPPLADLKSQDWATLESTLKSLNFEQNDGPAQDILERDPIPARGIFKPAGEVEIVDMSFDNPVLNDFKAIAVLRYVRIVPTPEFWEVLVCQVVEEGTGLIISEDLCKPIQRKSMSSIYTNTNPSIKEWFVSSELPPVEGPTWVDVQTQEPDVVAPVEDGPIEFNPEELPPGGGTIYVKIVEEKPVTPNVLVLELTEQRITHTFSLIDIFEEYGEEDISEYWLGSDSWFLRPSIQPVIERVSHDYAYDFNVIEESNPDGVSCPVVSNSTQSLVSYVRQASFRSKSWVDLDYLVQHMNRNIPDGYVIGAVEYADGGDWGVQMAENIAKDTANPVTPEKEEVIQASVVTLNQVKSRFSSFFRGPRFSLQQIPDGLRYRLEYQNITQGNPKHETEGETLVPRFYFTVFREDNLPLINHWAYVLDGNERLDIKDTPSEDGNFHKLQDGISNELKVGGRSQSARDVWHVPRTNTSIKDSEGVGIPAPSFSERIIEAGLPFYFISDARGLIEFELTSDGDPDIPEGSEPYKTPDMPRYSPEQDDRVIFEWDVVSEHWYVSEWTHGPNGSGTNYGTGEPTTSGTDYNLTRSRTECLEYDSEGECVKSGTCEITWSYSHDYGLQVGGVKAGDPDGRVHEAIFKESDIENQNKNRGYFEWTETLGEFNSFSDETEVFNGIQRPYKPQRRLEGLERTGPGNSPEEPSGAQDAEGDADTGRYGVVQERIVINTRLLRYAFDMKVFRHESTPNIGKQTPTTPPESKWVGTSLQGLNQVGTNPWRRKVGDGRSWDFVKVTEPLEFYTYIEMLYDTVQDSQKLYEHGNEIFVFSESLATLHLHDSVEIAWDNRNPSRSIRFESNQWSGHARVSWLELRGLGKNTQSPANIPSQDLQKSDTSKWYTGANQRVLPGGALFRTMQEPNNFVTFGVRTWQTFVQDDVRDLLGEYMPSIGREDLNFQGAIDHHRALTGKFSQKGGTGLINQSGARYVNLYVNGRIVGPDSSGPQRSNTPLEGLVLNNASRYWRTTEQDSNQTQSSRVTPINHKEDHTAFRMVARVDGVVVLERKDLGSEPKSPKGFASADGWTEVQSWSKADFAHLETEGRATLAGIAREIDLNTGLISGFFQALNRNQGNDPNSSMGYAPEWYNQAFRGIGVIVSESKWDYNIWDESGGGYRMQALDPRLTPNNNHGQVGMFTRAFPADARINAFTYQIGGNGDGGFRSANVPKFGREGRSTVGLVLADRPGNNTDYGGWLQGNDSHINHRFFIPNATVQDLR
jgi:hypothetical protein